MPRTEPLELSVPDSNVLVRLERLERENRRYRLFAAVAGLTCFAWVACGIGGQAKTTLSAERLVLVDANGEEKASFETDGKGNPILTLRNGKAFAALTTEGPALLLRGPDGKTGAFMGIDSKNTSRLELCSQRLLDGVRLSTHEDGSAGVYVLDSNGRQRGALESLATGDAGLNFRDGQGRVRSSFGLDRASLPNLLLLDEQGSRRLGMVVQADGNPILEMADDKGRARASLTTLFDGAPLLEMKRDDGVVTFQAP